MLLSLPKWYDLHVHFRQGPEMQTYIQAHKEMGCAGVLAMPNTYPPTKVVFKEDEAAKDKEAQAWSIENYLSQIRNAGGDDFDDIIVPLYLTKTTSAEMIQKGAAKKILRACKYYPPHGTTGAQFGADIKTYASNGVFKAMEEAGVVLCIHGEAHNLKAQDYFDADNNAEKRFYQETLPGIVAQFPQLRIVCEHITTQEACNFVSAQGDNVAATITPQHLLYTIGDLIQGLKYHLYCLPILKFEQDRQAIRQAATKENNQKFFAGTDSAPHAKKMTACGCAAGCFTGYIAPQLYAQAFEEAGLNLNKESDKKIFEQFLCSNGPKFYGLSMSTETFSLKKEEQDLQSIQEKLDENAVLLPIGMGESTLPWSIISY